MSCGPVDGPVDGTAPVRYRSDEEDSARWLDFPFRDGDIVVSTRSKSGTTWVQYICAMMIHRRATLPAPLGRLSPWIDHTVAPIASVLESLEQQSGRRVLKTHTPLDGIVLDPRVHYVVVARHPLDSAVSLYHQGDNIDREAVRRLTGAPAPTEPPPPRRPVHEWLVRWTQSRADPRESMDSLPGVLWHLRDAWSRRDEPNVTLVHYADLSNDLESTMRVLSRAVGAPIPDALWPDLVQSASFTSMRADARRTAPDGGILRDPARFFRGGRSGDGRALLSAAEYDAYLRRTAELAPRDLLDWLHRP